MSESAFTPNWRYNPIKHELQFWFSPTQAVAFQESLLKELEKLPLAPPMMFAEVVQLVGQGHIGAIGGWRNISHENLLKLPISTR
jgi:hypothetical protein